MFLYAVVENNGNDVYVPILVHKFRPILLYDKYSRIIGEQTLEKGEVDLPTDIWDDGDRDLTHAKRIKFNDNNDKDSNTWATMTIDKFNPKVFNLSKNTKLSQNSCKEATKSLVS